MKMRSIFLAVTLLLSAVLFSACSQSASELQDGYYTAEVDSFDEFGWKEFLTVYVSDNRIVTVEYNAKNVSGFIKSWDMEYMRSMESINGTYPNKYAREYAIAFLNKQDPDAVDVISGATTSHSTFQILAHAVLAQARAGDREVAIVQIPMSEEKAEG